MRKRFFQSLAIYSLNSLFFDFNVCLAVILYLIMNENVYNIEHEQYISSYSYCFYFLYINRSLWLIFYTFEGFMSIYITCDRIKMMKQFKSKVSVRFRF